MSAVQEYYLDTLRATRKLDGAKCPGEEVCTTDIRRGPIAMRAGETLETYCNRERCALYPTKPGTIPPDISSAVNAAEDLRDAQNTGLMPTHHELTAWEAASFKAATRAVKIVENELPEETKRALAEAKRRRDEAKQPVDGRHVRRSSAKPLTKEDVEAQGKGDGSAFNW